MIRSRIRRVSKKRAAENRLRKKILVHVRETQTWCSKCGAATRELDAHELLSRARGGSIVDLDNIVLLCRPCHDYVTNHPRKAAEEGWALSQWSA